ncbi:MAG TPA: pyruvate ferredoxin oxidoreductase [Thermoanaerobaculia bacterium]|nr:pyruvate ferredoxin oxidoreductase [Thermoanaerobaculia bacterium]
MPNQLISANHAAAAAAALAARANRFGRGFGGGIYPITPQTECIERLCGEEIEKGHLTRVESEHSAMAVCIGAALGGARTFTASSSNGLAYMAENVFAAGFFRLPIVMMAVNRTLGPPWNIWVDHGDTLALRDAGWVQLYCEDNQEVHDSILAAYRLAEDPRILLPVMVCQDAFVLSHTMMPTEIAEQAAVDRFLPPLELPHRLTEKPRVVGGLDFPHENEVHRRQQQEAMARVPEVYREVQDAFEAEFGRRPADAVVPYRMEDAEIVVVSMGTTGSTARTAVDAARQRGVRAGALRVRLFRPLPEEALRRALSGRRHVAVLDRDLSPGLGGILWGEIRGCAAPGAVVQNYVIGLGGGDIRPEQIERILDQAAQLERAAEPQFVEVG